MAPKVCEISQDRERTTHVARSKLPHAREQLSQTAVAESNADDDRVVGRRKAVEVDVADDSARYDAIADAHARQHERGQRKGAETERRRVGEAAVVDLGGQAHRGRSDARGRTAASSRAGGRRA